MYINLNFNYFKFHLIKQFLEPRPTVITEVTETDEFETKLECTLQTKQKFLRCNFRSPMDKIFFVYKNDRNHEGYRDISRGQ